MQFKVRFRTAFDDSARKEGICDSQKYPGIYEFHNAFLFQGKLRPMKQKNSSHMIEQC